MTNTGQEILGDSKKGLQGLFSNMMTNSTGESPTEVGHALKGNPIFGAEIFGNLDFFDSSRNLTQDSNHPMNQMNMNTTTKTGGLMNNPYAQERLFQDDVEDDHIPDEYDDLEANINSDDLKSDEEDDEDFLEGSEREWTQE